MGVLMEATRRRTSPRRASRAPSPPSKLRVAAVVSGSTRRTLKALYKAFEETEIERLRADNPGLKLSQLKERAFEWKSR